MLSDSKKSQTPAVIRRHRMTLNFNSRKSERTEVPSPPGYSGTSQLAGEAVKKIDQKLLFKKSWDTAVAPFKQGLMNVFVMYMAGNSISIFPIMLVGMMFIRPINAIFAIGSAFKELEGGQLYLQKFVYILGNLCGLGLALYKCQSMGLLPTHPSDWLDFLENHQRVEYSGGGVIM